MSVCPLRFAEVYTMLKQESERLYSAGHFQGYKREDDNWDLNVSESGTPFCHYSGKPHCDTNMLAVRNDHGCS